MTVTEQMVKTELLSDIEPFGALSLHTLHFIAQMAQLVDYGPGYDLYQQGDPPTGIYALRSGRVKLYRESKDKCQILALPMPGECFGAESVPTGASSPYSATTLTSASCVYLPPDGLQSLLDQHPEFQEVMLALITDRLKQFVTLVHDLAFRDVTSRLAMVLVSRAHKEGHVTEDGIYIDRLLSQQDYAAMVGTAREMIYRVFKKLETDRLIQTTRSSILILDLQKLSQIADEESR